MSTLQGNPLTLCQPFANLSPTRRQPLLPTPLQPLFPKIPGTRLETRVNGFLDSVQSMWNYAGIGGGTPNVLGTRPQGVPRHFRGPRHTDRQICGNGRQLQVQNQEIINLTQKPQRDFFLFFPLSTKRLKSDQKETF